MTSLPLISHHLFVAAIDHEAAAAEKDTGPTPAQGTAALEFEVLDRTDSIPEAATRALRVVATASAV